MGLLRYLQRKWLSDLDSCQGDSATAQPVTLELVQTAFIMAVVGVGVSVIVLIAECCFVKTGNHLRLKRPVIYTN
jgi:hypothetical protein